MANHSRQKHGKGQQRPPQTPQAIQTPEIEEKQQIPRLDNPSSWTADFCRRITSEARKEESPHDPHTWNLRALVLEEYEGAIVAGAKKSHPFKGMPVDKNGKELQVVIEHTHDDRFAILGTITAGYDRLPQAE